MVKLVVLVVRKRELLSECKGLVSSKLRRGFKHVEGGEVTIVTVISNLKPQILTQGIGNWDDTCVNPGILQAIVGVVTARCSVADTERSPHNDSDGAKYAEEDPSQRTTPVIPVYLERDS